MEALTFAGRSAPHAGAELRNPRCPMLLQSPDPPQESREERRRCQTPSELERLASQIWQPGSRQSTVDQLIVPHCGTRFDKQDIVGRTDRCPGTATRAACTDAAHRDSSGGIRTVRRPIRPFAPMTSTFTSPSGAHGGASPESGRELSRRRTSFQLTGRVPTPTASTHSSCISGRPRVRSTSGKGVDPWRTAPVAVLRPS